MKIEIKIILLLVISVLVIGCVGNPLASDVESNSKNITLQQLHDYTKLLYLKCDSSLTSDNCDNFLKTKRAQFENEVQGNYLIGEGTVKDVGHGIVYLSTPYPNYGSELRIALNGVQSDKSSELKKDEKIFFRGQINLKDSGMCNTYCRIQYIYNTIQHSEAFNPITSLPLYSGEISKSMEYLTPVPTPTVNPCLISENPPYPNGWTKEQVKEFNERIKDQPCRKLRN